MYIFASSKPNKMKTKFTRAYAEQLATIKYPYATDWPSNAIAIQENNRLKFIDGYMRAIEETAAPELLEALIELKSFLAMTPATRKAHLKSEKAIQKATE